ncbi:MAG: anion permease [Oscillospiraceae bacterium]|nr:anion permease [Oscillospiraceae bacterium]
MSLNDKPAFPRARYINYLIALVIGILLWFIPQPNEYLRIEGIRLIAVVIPTLYLWLMNETLWGSLLCMAVLGMTGIIQSVDAAGEVTRVWSHNALWMEALGNFAVILLIVFLILDGCLNETGAIKKVANWFLTRKSIEGKPYVIIGMFLLSNIVVGMFMQNLALAVMYLALTKRFCENLGLEKSHSLYKALMLGTLWGNGVLSIASPIAKFFPNLLIGLIYSQLGVQISYAQWFAVGIPFAIIMYVLIMVVIRIYNPDVKPLLNFKVDEYRKNEDPPLGKRGKIALITTLALLVFILVPDIALAILGGPAVATGAAADMFRTIVSWGATVPAILAIVFLCLVRAEGKPVMNIMESAKNVSLPFIIFLAVVIFLGSPMSSGFASNIVPWMNSIFGPLVEGMTPFLLAALMVIVGIIITNFISSVIIVQVFFALSVALFTATGMPGPVYAAAMGIIVGFFTCMSALTPASVVTAAMYYGDEKGIVVKEVLKPNLLFMLFAAIGIILTIPIVTGILGA